MFLLNSLEKEMQKVTVKSAASTSTNQQSADQGIITRSLVPEDPTGETDCRTFVLSQDNKE